MTIYRVKKLKLESGFKISNQRKWAWLNKESISGGAIKEKGPKQDVVEKWELVLENSFTNGKILSLKKS